MNLTLSGNTRRQRYDLHELLRRARCLNDVYVSNHFAERCLERNVDPVDVLWCIKPMLDVLRNSTYNDRKMLSCHRGVKVVGKIYTDSRFNRRRICLKTVIDSVGNNDYFDDIFTK